VSPRDQELVAGATEEEKGVAAAQVLWDIAGAANFVDMGDGTLASLPDDPDWS